MRGAQAPKASREASARTEWVEDRSQGARHLCELRVRQSAKASPLGSGKSEDFGSRKKTVGESESGDCRTRQSTEEGYVSGGAGEDFGSYEKTMVENESGSEESRELENFESSDAG